MLLFPPLLSWFLSHAPSPFPPSKFLCHFLPFSPAMSSLPSFRAWPSGDNMFWGDKQAHAASEGQLRQSYACALACAATRGPDKSPAVGLHCIVFRDIRCASQCRWSLRDWMAQRPERCVSCVQIMAEICKHWHRKTLDASFQHGGITGHGSSCKRGQACYAQRCWL